MKEVSKKKPVQDALHSQLFKPWIALDIVRAELEQNLSVLELLADDVVLPQFECDPDNLADILTLVIRELKRIDKNILTIQLDISTSADCSAKDGDQHGEKES